MWVQLANCDITHHMFSRSVLFHQNVSAYCPSDSFCITAMMSKIRPREAISQWGHRERKYCSHRWRARKNASWYQRHQAPRTCSICFTPYRRLPYCFQSSTWSLDYCNSYSTNHRLLRLSRRSGMVRLGHISWPHARSNHWVRRREDSLCCQ